jgi:hypothetical protein
MCMCVYVDGRLAGLGIDDARQAAQEPTGSEPTVVQRGAIDIGELEREMKAAGKLTARGREMISLICGRQTSVRGCGGSKLRQQQRAA